MDNFLRSKGGRGLIQLEATYKTATIGFHTYLNTKNDSLFVIGKEHEKEKTKKTYSVASPATMFRRELNLPESLKPENEALTIFDKKVRAMPKIN